MSIGEHKIIIVFIVDSSEQSSSSPEIKSTDFDGDQILFEYLPYFDSSFVVEVDCTKSDPSAHVVYIERIIAMLSINRNLIQNKSV